VKGGGGGQGSKVQFAAGHKGGSGHYKSKGLWDQRITKEWMDIYNKPLYTPLHKIAAAVR
jgi:hypothetical protein